MNQVFWQKKLWQIYNHSPNAPMFPSIWYNNYVKYMHMCIYFSVMMAREWASASRNQLVLLTSVWILQYRLNYSSSYSTITCTSMRKITQRLSHTTHILAIGFTNNLYITYHDLELTSLIWGSKFNACLNTFRT